MSGRFSTRPTRYVGLATINGWRIKQYEITLDGAPISAAVNAATHQLLTDTLPPTNGGVGFVIAHRGADQMWLLADRWHGDIVHQHSFFADLATPTDFQLVPVGGPTVCVWEFAVHTHERDAYIEHVLNPHSGPDHDAYLADVLTLPARSRRDLLEAFGDAWARSDVNALMELMSDDPTYRASTGDGPGTEYHGRDAVRQGFEAVIAAENLENSPAPPAGTVHVAEDRGFSTWSYSTVGPDGMERVVEGIDAWTFDGDRIATKDAYRKSFPDPLAP